MLTGKKILLGITGSIAAYKAPLVVRLLVKAGAEVKVVMTTAATTFVSTLTLTTLSKHTVLWALADDDTWANHVALGRWADVFLIAPASCNTISKMAAGACDNLLMATYLSATCPVAIAPAMDEDMWHHATTRANIKTLRQQGCMLLPVGYGELASGLTGEGRMAEPERILSFLEDFFSHPQPLKGKKALVTAGPTYEAIDPVRFIGNHSSGKMGWAIAEELARQGAEVTLVSGPVALEPTLPNIRRVDVVTAGEMYEACLKVDYDVAVMAAAVADYTPLSVAEQKIKKSTDTFDLRLKKTIDIAASLGANKSGGQVLVVFALETENEAANAQKKLATKNADMVVLNSLRDEGAGFTGDTNKITVFTKQGNEKSFPLLSKTEQAKNIVGLITDLLK